MEDLAHYKMPKLEQTPSVKVESGLEEADQKPPHWYLFLTCQIHILGFHHSKWPSDLKQITTQENTYIII